MPDAELPPTLGPIPPRPPLPAAKKSNRIALRPLLSWPVGLVAIVALAIGIVGGVALRPSPTSSTEYRALSTSSERTAGELSELQTEFDELEGDYNEIAAREGDITTGQATLDARESELDKRAADLDKREAEVSGAENEKETNSFGGGVQVVGDTVKAGTYRSTEITSGLCYYAWLESTEADADIVDNNIVEEGTATVTLADGQIFESSGCGTWNLVG